MYMFDWRPRYLSLLFDEGSEGGAGDNGAKGSAADGGTEGTGKNAGKTGAEKGDGADDRDAPKYSDADLDRIIERKLAKWQKQQQKAVDEATRLANMTAQERAEHERDTLQKELNDLKRANTLAEMEKTARAMLRSDEVDLPDDIIALIVDEDADKTSANVKSISKAYKKAVQDGVKKALTHKSPSTGASGTLTKDEIMKIKDPQKRIQAIRENMGLFGH